MANDRSVVENRQRDQHLDHPSQLHTDHNTRTYMPYHHGMSSIVGPQHGFHDWSFQQQQQQPPPPQSLSFRQHDPSYSRFMVPGAVLSPTASFTPENLPRESLAAQSASSSQGPVAFSGPLQMNTPATFYPGDAIAAEGHQYLPWSTPQEPLTQSAGPILGSYVYPITPSSPDQSNMPDASTDDRRFSMPNLDGLSLAAQRFSQDPRAPRSLVKSESLPSLTCDTTVDTAFSPDHSSSYVTTPRKDSIVSDISADEKPILNVGKTTVDRLMQVMQAGNPVQASKRVTKARKRSPLRKRAVKAKLTAAKVAKAELISEATDSDVNDDSTTDFACDWPACTSVFNQKTHLDIHYRMHTGDRPFDCKYPGCGKSFAQLGNLKTHERRHTGERPYKCDTCGKTFAQRGNVNAHQAVHNRRRIFVCKLDNCERLFGQLGNLKTHQNKFHSEELLRLTERFAYLKRNGLPTPEDEKAMELYLMTYYKNCNKGIKGRGKETRIHTAPATHAAHVMATPVTPASTTSCQPIKLESVEMTREDSGYNTAPFLNSDPVSASSSFSSQAIYSDDAANYSEYYPSLQPAYVPMSDDSLASDTSMYYTPTECSSPSFNGNNATCSTPQETCGAMWNNQVSYQPHNAWVMA